MTSLYVGPMISREDFLSATFEASQNKYLNIFNYLTGYAFILCGNVISSNMTTEHVFICTTSFADSYVLLMQ